MVISLFTTSIVLHMFNEPEKKIMKTTTWIFTSNNIQIYFSHQMTHTLFDLPIYRRWSQRVRCHQVQNLTSLVCWAGGYFLKTEETRHYIGIIALHLITTGSCLDPMISRPKWAHYKMNFFTSNHTISCTNTNSHIVHKRLVLYMSISGNYLKKNWH